jgi:hypothetical protein
MGLKYARANYARAMKITSRADYARAMQEISLRRDTYRIKKRSDKVM